MSSSNPTEDIYGETLAVFEGRENPWEPLTTTEVADGLDCGRRTAYKRLERLCDRDDVETKKVGARGRVWWRSQSQADERVANGGSVDTTDSFDSDGQGDRGSNLRSRRFDSLVEEIEDYAIFMLDPDGHVVSWNTGAEQIKGYEESEIVGEQFSVFYTSDDREAGVPQRDLREATEQGRIEDEGWRLRADGTRFWANVVMTAITDERGEVEGYAKVTRDMTERRERERQLRREREKTEQLLRTSPVAIAVQNADGETIQANQRAQDILGLSEQEIIEDPEVAEEWTVYDSSGDPLDPESTPSAQVLRTSEPVYDQEIAIEPPEGERIWVSISAAPLLDDDGSIERIVLAGEDVTERRRQAKWLEQRSERLETELDEIFSRISDGFYAVDSEWRITHVNETAEELLQREASAVLGMDLWEVFPEAVDTVVSETFEEAMETQEAASFEVYYDRIDTWVEATAHPSESGLSVYLRDVTDRKERERALERYRTIVETVDDGVYTVDVDGHFTMVNDAYAEMIGRSKEDLVGSHVSTVVDEEVMEQAREFEQRLLDGEMESAKLTTELEVADGEFLIGEAKFAVIAATANEPERVAVVRDVTERKERERELRARVSQQDAVTRLGQRALSDPDVEALADEAVEAVAGTLDVEYSKVLDHRPDRDDLLLRSGVGWQDGLVGSASVPDDEGSQAGYTLLTDEPVVVDDLESETRFSGPDLLVDHDVTSGVSVVIGSPEEPWGVLGTHTTAHREFSRHDVNFVRSVATILANAFERREHERALERYRTIVETVQDGVYVLDEEFNFTMVNDAYVEMTGYDRDDLLGSHSSLVVDDDVSAESGRMIEEIVAGDGDSASLEADIHRADGSLLPAESNFTALPSADGERPWKVGVVRDVTERKRYEETLRALHRSSRRLLAARTDEEVAELVVEDATDVLDLPGVVVYHHDPDDGVLVPAASSVDAESMRREFPPVPAGEDSITGRVFATGEPTALDDVRESPDLHVEPTDTEIRAGLFFPLDDHGVLVVGSRSAGGFDERERQLVELLATNAEAAYDRVERENRLRQQRDHLTALDDFNTVVRDINRALVQQSTREEIEALVCERLADSDAYEFAWISGIDSATQGIEPHVEAGVDGYLDEVDVSTDPDHPAGDGSVARAARTQELQVVRDLPNDPEFEQWWEVADRYGFRSIAAIPIVYEETLSGILGVYSARPDAFSEEERAVVGQLGELVGLAIASVERKRALMSDEVVELEFEARDVFADFGVASQGTIAFDRTVPVEDGEFLVYGTADPDGMGTIRALVDELPHWTSASTIGDGDEEVRFQLHLTEPTAISAVASHGGYVETARIAGGDLAMTVHLPPTVDVRNVVGRVQEAYPDVQVLRKRQLTRTEDSPQHLETVLAEKLTDRQRSALEAAYFAGFFEWPRDSSGEDVAESLGVSGPTFFYHVRKAERKLLETLLEGSPALS